MSIPLPHGTAVMLHDEYRQRAARGRINGICAEEGLLFSVGYGIMDLFE